MPLPNRVDPFGNLFADSSRGLFFGNRGGRFHRDDRTLGNRRWVSRTWICCRLEFKGRHPRGLGQGLYRSCSSSTSRPRSRPVTGPASNAGVTMRRRSPRPLRRGSGEAAPRAAAIDAVLHAERLDGRAKRRHRAAIGGLPDGAGHTLGAPAGERLCGARRLAAALDARRLCRTARAAARGPRRSVDAARRGGGAGGRLSPALASERRALADPGGSNRPPSRWAATFLQNLAVDGNLPRPGADHGRVGRNDLGL